MLIQIQPRRLLHAEYVLRWARRSQENDQLLRQRWQRPYPPRRHDSRHPIGSGPMEEDPSAAMEATVFTGWIYDHLKPHAAALKWANGAQAPEAHFDMYRDWQEITNSIFCGGPRGAETANGCLVLYRQGTH